MVSKYLKNSNTHITNNYCMMRMKYKLQHCSEEYNGISFNDVKEVLKSMKNRKASSIDNILMEMWKYRGDSLMFGLYNFVMIFGFKGKYQRIEKHY